MAVGLFAVAGMALLATTVARAGDQDFKLVNKTGVEIHALHVAPHSSNEWGEDILGKDTLDNGESLEITFGKHDRAHHVLPSCRDHLQVLALSDEEIIEEETAAELFLTGCISGRAPQEDAGWSRRCRLKSAPPRQTGRTICS